MPRPNVSQQKKEQICLALLKCMGEEDYNNISIKAIALAANIPLGSVYYYYPTKQDILMDATELFSDYLNQQRILRFQKYLRPATSQDVPASISREDLRALIVEEQPNKISGVDSHYYSFLLLAQYNLDVKEIMYKGFSNTLELYRLAFQPYMQDSRDPALFAKMCVSFLDGLIADSMIAYSAEDITSLIDAFIDTVAPRFLRIQAES